MIKPRRWAVIQFPGSNCDQDVFRTFKLFSQIEAVMHWHEDPIKPGLYEVIVLPGGFSFGDYLRAGAIAKISPAMKDLEAVVEAGTHLMGICNGFQILLETRLLPGYLQVNSSLRFVSETVELEITEECLPWYSKADIGKKVRYPIAHKFGNYQPSKIDTLESKPALRYLKNPNGSFENIAGVYRKLGKGSIFGLMPHPERAAFSDLMLTDGFAAFQNAVEILK